MAGYKEIHPEPIDALYIEMPEPIYEVSSKETAIVNTAKGLLEAPWRRIVSGFDDTTELSRIDQLIDTLGGGTDYILRRLGPKEVKKIGKLLMEEFKLYPNGLQVRRYKDTKHNPF